MPRFLTPERRTAEATRQDAADRPDPSRAFPVWLLAGLVLIYALEWLAATLGSVEPHSALVAWAVAVDLVVVLPTLYWWLAVRRLGWPWFSVVPVALAGSLTARAWAPEAEGLLALLELLLVPLEVAVVTTIAAKARSGWRRYSADSERDLDASEALQRAAAESVGEGRVAEILATELAVFAYAFGFWRKSLPEASERQFFSRRTSGYGLLVGGVAVATAVEIFPVHLMLHHFWSPVAAWVVTGLSLYGLVWLLADWQAQRRHGIEICDDALRIRVGLRWRFDVPYERIESIRRVKASEVRVEGALSAFPSGRPTHCIELREPVTAVGIYGVREPTSRIAVLVDEKERFEQALVARIPR